MRHIVIGTAGHIDHGKSTLVQALTGIDPDRLKEEKARGITIDLGFAHCQIGETRVAFVDVPGHERFVRNMLAGATGIDAVLLVVSAEESVMPQTREHFAICRLLDVRAGLVALTKCDAAGADADMIEVARSEVGELVAGSFLEGAPVVAVSAKTGVGLEALRQAIVRVAAQAPSRATDGPMRLPIDRAFSMKGFGAVVTGTLVSGVLRVEDEVDLLPSGRRVRVRGLQVHGERVREATSGQRVAANLDDVDTSQITRGDLLATPGAFAQTTRCDVTFDLLADARPLAHGTRVRIHHGTREALGRISIVDIMTSDDEAAFSNIAGHANSASAAERAQEAVAAAPEAAGTAGDASAARVGSHAPLLSDVATVVPGGRARARVRLEAPMVMTRGDRFVLRAYSPVVTIGGGCVIDPHPPRGAVRSAAGQARFAALDAGVGSDPLGAEATDRAALVMLDERGPEGLPLSMFVERLGLRAGAVDAAARRLEQAGHAVRIGGAGGAGELLVSRVVLERLGEALIDQVTRHHQALPDSEGVPREEARDRLGVAPRVFEHVLQQLAQAGKLQGRDRLALTTHRATVPDADGAALAGVEAAVRTSGLKPPDVAELARTLAMPPTTVERLVVLLVRQKRLVKIEGLIFHPDTLARLKDETRALKVNAPTGRAVVDVASFKTRYDVSRKYAIPLLEYLDRERITRRVGDERVVL